MKRGRLGFVVGGIFAGVGVLLAIVGVAVLISTLGFLGSAERTEGTVTGTVAKTSTHRDNRGHSRPSTAYYPTVRFTADGRDVTFTSSTGSNPPTYQTGDRVLVAYDPANPVDARVDTFVSLYLLPLIFGGIAVIFMAVGIPLFVTGRSRLRRDAWLRQHGREVRADIAEIDIDASTRINGRNPFIVRATWRDPDTGHTYTAVSDQLRNDPGPRLSGQRHVRVLVDPENPERSVVDLDTSPRA